jgi:hypothetical protein
MTLMQSREDAILWLQTLGFFAAKIDWIIGESIWVATDQIHDYSFRAFRHAVYIHRQANQWCLTDFSNGMTETKNCGTLEQAAHEAVRVLQEKSARDYFEQPRLCRVDRANHAHKTRACYKRRLNP